MGKELVKIVKMERIRDGANCSEKGRCDNRDSADTSTLEGFVHFLTAPVVMLELREGQLAFSAGLETSSLNSLVQAIVQGCAWVRKKFYLAAGAEAAIFTEVS